MHSYVIFPLLFCHLRSSIDVTSVMKKEVLTLMHPLRYLCRIDCSLEASVRFGFAG